MFWVWYSGTGTYETVFSEKLIKADGNNNSYSLARGRGRYDLVVIIK